MKIKKVRRIAEELHQIFLLAEESHLRGALEHREAVIEDLKERILELRNGEPDNYREAYREQQKEIERLKNIIRGKTAESLNAT